MEKSMEPNVSWDTFKEFFKIGRLSRDCTITEKIDGTNAQISISEDGQIKAASRTRWITPQSDNHGFAGWVERNKEELLKLGPGRHYGEWWGLGINRNYGLKEKRLSLFNPKWNDDAIRPACCSVVPTLYEGPFTTETVDDILDGLEVQGSAAAPGFMKPEGVVVWHSGARVYFKKTLENDEGGKGHGA